MTWKEKLIEALPNISPDIVNWDIIGNHCPREFFGGFEAPEMPETDRPIMYDDCRRCWESDCNCCE